MSQLTNRYTKAQVNQLVSNSLAEDGALCNYLLKEYDEQATYNGGEGARKIFQNLNEKIKLYHIFLRNLIGEDRVDINEAIPVIDFQTPENTSFLKTYAVTDNKVDSTVILDLSSQPAIDPWSFRTEKPCYQINHALAGDQESEYFYNTRSLVSSQYNIQTSAVTSEQWAYLGVRTQVAVINGNVTSADKLQKDPIYYYQHTDFEETKIILTMDDLRNGNSEIQIPMQNFYGSASVKALKNGGPYDKYLALLYPGADGQSPIKFQLPYCPFYNDPEHKLGVKVNESADDTTNRIVFPIQRGDIVFFIPDYTLSLTCQYKVLIFKHIQTALIPEPNSDFTNQAILKYKGNAILNYAAQEATETASSQIPSWTSNYLVFLTYTSDYKTFFNLTQCEAGQLVDETLNKFFETNHIYFESILNIERWYFGESSGLLNGLYSAPFEYDTTLTDYTVPTNDDLRHPKVLRWKFANDLETAIAHGQNIEKGTRYYPGHILNRGTIISAPLRLSGADPVGKLTAADGTVTLVYNTDTDYTVKSQSPNYSPYYGKAELFYDLLNNMDFSGELFQDYTTKQQPLVLKGVLGSVRTQEWFMPSIMTYGERLQVEKTDSLGLVSKVPVSAEDIVSYLDKFRGMFQTGIVSGYKTLCVDRSSDEDPALYYSMKVLEPYQRVSGNTTKTVYVDKKGGEQHDKDAKGRVPVSGVFDALTYEEVAQESRIVNNHSLTEVLQNPEKSVFISYIDQYPGDYHQRGIAPEIYQSNSDGSPNTSKPSTYVTPVYLGQPLSPSAFNANTSGSTVNISSASCAYARECSVRVLTPMDVFGALTGQTQIADRFLVYPAKTDQFPESLFLFTKEPVGLTAEDKSKEILVTFWTHDPTHPDQDEKFILFRVADSWDYNYATDCKYIQLTSNETEKWRMVRRNKWSELKDLLPQYTQNNNAAMAELSKYPDYSGITYEKVTYTVVSDRRFLGIKIGEKTETKSYYRITYPQSTTNTTNVNLVLNGAGDMLILQLLCQQLGIDVTDTTTITSYLRDLEFLSSLDLNDKLNELINLPLIPLSPAFRTLLTDLKNWAAAKKQYLEWTSKYTKLMNDLKAENGQNNLTQEFHCYLLQPVLLDFEKILTEKTKVYSQELTNVDQNEPVNILGDNNLVKLLPISSPANYFHINQELVADGIYSRSGVSQANINADLQALEEAQICFFAPAFSSAHPASYFSQYGSGVFKALGAYFDEALSNPKSGIRALTARITTEFLSKFQLSVVQNDPRLTPIMLTELPEVLHGLQAMERPLKMLAASGVQIPLSPSEVSSYALDSQANLGDLNKLLNRFENDILYDAVPFKIQIDPRIPDPDWSSISLGLTWRSDQSQDYIEEITYNVAYSDSHEIAASGFTHLTTAEETVFKTLAQAITGTDLTEKPSSLNVNFINLYQGLEQHASDTDSDKAYVSLFNKLFHMVFKAQLQAVFIVTGAESETKVLKSFKYLEQTFAAALDNAEINGFDQVLCHNLDLYFGNGTRPFFNLESRSCSLAVDEQVLGLKQSYLEQTAQQCFKLLNSLQTKALAQDTLLDDLWSMCFQVGSTMAEIMAAKNKYRLGSYKVKADSKVPVNFQYFGTVTPSDMPAMKAQAKEAIKQAILAIRPKYTAGGGFRVLFIRKSHSHPYRIASLSDSDIFKYLHYWQGVGITSAQRAEADEFLAEVSSNILVYNDWVNFCEAARTKVKTYYNQLVTQIFTEQDQKFIKEKDISDYLGGESFDSDPGQITFFDKVVYVNDASHNKLSYYTYSWPNYTKVSNPVVGTMYYVPKWAYYNETSGINNYYYIPQYRNSDNDSSNIIVSPRYAAIEVGEKFYGVGNGTYQITLNLNLPDISFNSETEKYTLDTPAALVSDLLQHSGELDPEDPDTYKVLDILSRDSETAWTDSDTTDSSAVYQTVLPVPTGNQADASEAMLLAIVDIARKALTGKGTDKVLPGTPVKMLENDTEPSGDPTGLYFKRYQALNTRMNRLNGPLAAAGRYLRNQSSLTSLHDVEEQAIETYKNLMTVVPIARMAELAYMPTREAVGSTYALDGKFYYTAEMTALRQQISDKCVLVCHSCPVSKNCIFYDEEEVLKTWCPPAQYLDLYFKDNELDLLYYDEDPDHYSPDIYEYQEVLNPETGKVERQRIGESFGHEYFQALHKPYSEILLKYQDKTYNKVAENRPIRTDVDSTYFVMPSLESEFKQSPRLSWNEKLDGNLSWLTNARYGTIEVNDMAGLLEKNYPALRDSIRPYKYLYNAVYVFDEETEFNYTPSSQFYNIDDFYIFDKNGMPHRYGGRTKIKLPTSLKAFMEASSDDDVYLVSDDTRDSNNNEISPVIYLDTVGNLRKPGRTTFNINTTSTTGIQIPGDRAVYAQDIANWCVRYAKNHNANEPASGTEPLGSHRSLAENRDQYWMPSLSKQIINKDGVKEIITVPGRPRVSSGYQEPLLDPENPDEAAILSGKPGTADYINFIRRFSIKLCEPHPTDVTKVIWKIKWIKGLDNPETEAEKQQIEEKRRTLALMKTNLRLVIVKNN